MGVEEITAIRSIWDGFDFTYILSILMGLIPSLICITLHELSHGYAAYRLGDDTAKRMGRLTLNPLKHLDIVGLLMMLVFHVGWAKPVPVNMRSFKNPKRDMAITALAGPVSNILIALIVLFVYGALYIPLSAGAVGEYFLDSLRLMAYISLGLGLFNLLPVPPLDGSKILFSFMSNERYYKLMRYERYGMILMVALMWSGALGEPLTKAIDFVFIRLVPIAQWSFDKVYYLFYV